MPIINQYIVPPSLKKILNLFSQSIPNKHIRDIKIIVKYNEVIKKAVHLASSF